MYAYVRLCTKTVSGCLCTYVSGFECVFVRMGIYLFRVHNTGFARACTWNGRMNTADIKTIEFFDFLACFWQFIRLSFAMVHLPWFKNVAGMER